MYDVSNMLSPLKEAVISIYKGIKFITGTFTNIRAKDASFSSIPTLSPYGQGNYPPVNMQGVLVSTQDSNKQYYCVGFINTIPPIPYDMNVGESWNFSLNYTLVYQNNGLIAYRNNDNTYHATLVSGEWMQKILTDIIDDNNTTIRDYINTEIVPAFSGLGVTIPPIATNTTLDDDKIDISNNEILITDDGSLP